MGDGGMKPLSRRELFGVAWKAGLVGSSLLLPNTLQGRVLAAPLLPGRKDRDSVVVRWNAAALQGVRESKLGPPMVSRALAIVHTSAFDAWAAYDKAAVGTRLGGGLRRPPNEWTLANKSKANSFAAYRAAVALLPG